ncbi:MAG TPA: hypothetical protein VGD29_19700 [Actinoplanes sp.]
MSPDDVHQVRIEDASRTLGDGVLVGPGFAVTTAAVLRDAGPVVALRAPGSDAPVAAEVVEVLSSEGLVLLEVAAPGFDVPFNPTMADQVLRFRRFEAGRLLADLKFGGERGREGESSAEDSASERAGGTRRTATGRTATGRTATDGRERGALLLAYLKERARTGRLDPVVTVPALEDSR